ncbi:MAG: hypothetical protein ACI9VR_002229 [Cognaticolwellia sp.]|jgi:hypothetical protein
MIRNRRDAGASINALAGQHLLREGLLWRSGRLEGLTSLAELGEGAEVVNLREETDPVLGAKIHHLPIADTLAVYQVSENLAWLSTIHAAVAMSKGPILIHCAAGTDRTGVAVASVLMALEVDPKWILADYLKSPPTTHPERLQAVLVALATWESPHRDALRDRFC